jgi:hypothetical protein
VPRGSRQATLATLVGHNVVRLAGMSLGSRADVLPGQLRRWLSLERRAGYTPLGQDDAPPPASDHAPR